MSGWRSTEQPRGSVGWAPYCSEDTVSTEDEKEVGKGIGITGGPAHDFPREDG